MEVFKTAGGRFFSSKLLKKPCIKARELVWAAKFFTHQIGVIDVASNRRSQDSSTTTWQLEISISIYQEPVIFPRNTNSSEKHHSTYKLEALISIPWVLYLLDFCRQPISTFGSSDLCLPGLTFLFHSHQGECFQNIWSSWCQGQNQKVHPKFRIPKVFESPKESSLFWNAHLSNQRCIWTIPTMVGPHRLELRFIGFTPCLCSTWLQRLCLLPKIPWWIFFPHPFLINFVQIELIKIWWMFHSYKLYCMDFSALHPLRKATIFPLGGLGRMFEEQ